MTKRETLILKYLTTTSNRLRLIGDHLKAEILEQEEPTESTDDSKLYRYRDVPETLQVYKFYLSEIKQQSDQIEELLKLLEKKNS